MAQHVLRRSRWSSMQRRAHGIAAAAAPRRSALRSARRPRSVPSSSRARASSISLEGLLRPLFEAFVELAVVRDGREIAEMVVIACRDLAELVLEAAGVLALEELHGCAQSSALLLELLSQRIRVEVAHLRSFLPAAAPANRRSASS